MHSEMFFNFGACARLTCVFSIAWSLGTHDCGAQFYEEVFDFTETRRVAVTGKGSSPQAALVQGPDGNLYGTTLYGGANNEGTAFRISPDGVLTTLVEFAERGPSNMGRSPSGLVLGGDGNFYGTTGTGGVTSNFGTVFRMTPAGALTTIVEFSNNGATNKGRNPYGGLVAGNDGMLYGATYSGGASGYGTVFKVSLAGVLTTLVEFTGNGATNKGRGPYSALIQGTDGNFYGTTELGGIHNLGTIFKVTPTGVLTTLVEFTGNGTLNKGATPYAGLSQGNDGHFYGMTQYGGVGYTGAGTGHGTIFRMTAAGVLTTLVEFTQNGASNKGRGPRAGLVQAGDGNFYGVTQRGGADNSGTLFRMTPAGVLSTLVEFTGNGVVNKGDSPSAALLQAGDGQMYGTTLSGGLNGLGTVFKVSSTGSLTTLVEFATNGASDFGRNPRSGLTQSADGNFFGTTSRGGTMDLGTVFKMSADGTVTPMAAFTGNGANNKGSLPYSNLVQGGDGNFYGATREGGAYGYGTLFRMTPLGEVTTLVEFTGNGATNKGCYPSGALVQGVDGNFYGTTERGGPGFNVVEVGMSNYANGTVFRLTTAGVLTTLVEFTNNGASNKGSQPSAGLALGADGNFYGTTQAGGANGQGTIFRVTPVGALVTLVEFTGNTGANKGNTPYAGLIRGSDGNFYGTTQGGGANGLGTVFRMTQAGVLTTMAEFNGTTTGSNPYAGLALGADGNFYGTTAFGGAGNVGTIFKMTQAGVLSTIRDFFGGADSDRPYGGLLAAADGNLYGATSGLATLNGDGTLFRIILPGKPSVVIKDAVVDATNSVSIQVLVSARGTGTNVTLEYGTDGVSFPVLVPLVVNLSGYQTRLMGETLPSLAAATTYYYRVRAVNSSGTTLTPVRSFSTLAAPQCAATAVSEVAVASARLNGAVNARNYDATVRFEWGTDGNSFPNTLNATPAIVTGNAAVAVSAPVAGLTKGTTYYYRVVAANAGGTTVSGTQSFRTLTEPTAAIGGSFALSTTSVRVDGTVHAQGSDSSVVFEYGTDGVSFPNSVAATPGTVTGDAGMPVSAVLTTLSQGVTYHYRIKATSAGGTGTSSSASFSMNVLSGFAQVFPSAPPEADGFLIVNLMPPGILSGWRFVGEQQWRASGVAAGGLTTGNRDIEFRPVPGYNHPPLETVEVISGQAATVLTLDYYDAFAPGNGALTVTLKPDSITTGPERAQWRFLGEDDSRWRDSGETEGGLVAGSHLIECKAVAGRSTPPNANVVITPGNTTLATLTYFLADAPAGTPPGVLAFESVTGDTTRPYAFAGQLRSDAGVGTGFVVKPRVVATAAHVLWNDGTLSAAQGMQWLFQRHRGLHEPLPIEPRGFYLFSSYSGQRAAEATPGFFSPQSQHLDVAALYFTENAGRGGHGGFLASDLEENEFLLSNANKMLVGYPVDGIALTSQGRMHATPPMNVVFDKAFGRTFTTTGIRSSGGNSGGPLCVQFEGGAYYPAAICLGGSGQMVVRAIDSAVLDLFGYAEISGAGGGGIVGGGASHTTVTPIDAGGKGSIRVLIESAEARNAGAWWKLSPSSTARPSGFQINNLTPGGYVVNLATLAGYQAPAAQHIPITANTLTTITYTYQTAMSAQESWRQTYFGTTANSGDAADNHDYDRDGFTNAEEYAAGTNPVQRGDFFRANNPQRGSGTFSVSTAGRVGRSYILERSATMAAGTWSTVDTEGPLAADGPVTLTDAASPSGAAFYRIRVTGP
jgi:uncharacterized repeat protein (TIGR03803 family)